MTVYGFKEKAVAEQLKQMAGAPVVRRRRNQGEPPSHRVITKTEDIYVITAIQVTDDAVQYKQRLVRVHTLDEASDWIDLPSEACAEPAP